MNGLYVIQQVTEERVTFDGQHVSILAEVKVGEEL